MEKREFIVMDYSEFNNLIKKHYGKNYEFLPDQESNNDCLHKFIVEKRKLDDYDLEVLNKFKKTGAFYNLACTLFQDLCNKGILKEGDYLIEVCW